MKVKRPKQRIQQDGNYIIPGDSVKSVTIEETNEVSVEEGFILDVLANYVTIK